MSEFLLSYNHVYLRPKHSDLNSRDEADTSVSFLDCIFKVPFVPANMIDVISFENAKYLSLNGYFYIMHRFENVSVKFAKYAIDNNLPIVSLSFGVNDDSKKDLDDILNILEDKPLNFATIDVAHGDHKKVAEMIKTIKIRSPRTKVIAGNVGTSSGYNYLCEHGADAVKVGIGGGGICSTRFKTGFHTPTLQSIRECYIDGNWRVPIIADGGVTHYGDIAKALVFGAKMVMCGYLFASCIDSPAKIINGKKQYRGSTSYEAKGVNKHVEGIMVELEEGITYKERIEEMKQSLCSSISYAGGNNLDAFKNVEWRVVL